MTLPRWLLAALLLCWAVVLQAAPVAIPPLSARVTDLTQTLDAGQRAQLESQLAGLEQRKGAQIAVLLVPTTGEDSIEDYTVRAFEQWKLGRKGVDDGVLLVVAKNDRTLRIEVGYGLEGTITDVQAGRIIREQIVPFFQKGDFAGGIQAGVDSLIALIEPPSAAITPDGSEDELPHTGPAENYSDATRTATRRPPRKSRPPAWQRYSACSLACRCWACCCRCPGCASAAWAATCCAACWWAASPLACCWSAKPIPPRCNSS